MWKLFGFFQLSSTENVYGLVTFTESHNLYEEVRIRFLPLYQKSIVMKIEKVVLLLGGLACLSGFFLPYLTLGNQSISGFDETMAIVDYFTPVEQEQGDWAWDLLSNTFDSITGAKGYGLLAMLAIVLLGPFIFAIYGLSYVIKALAKKQYKRGVFVNLLFMGFAWLTFYLFQEQNSVSVLGMDLGAKLNFFKMAGIGYWVMFSGMMVAAFSLFFGKTE